MNIIIVIPARLESKRLNRKLLLPGLNNRPLLYYTWKQATQSNATEVHIATDNVEIATEASKFGASIIMTSTKPRCGTERVHEAIQKLTTKPDIIINIQGDEPEIRPQDINTLIERTEYLKESGPFNYEAIQSPIYTLAVPLHNYLEYVQPQNVKVVFDHNYEAIFFSRSMIPWVSDINNELSNWKTKKTDPIAYKHIGVYAYSPRTLDLFVETKPTRLERIEGLEQMRAIESGWPIKVIPLDAPEDDNNNIWPLSINTQQDYETWLKRPNSGRITRWRESH
jgi:3-deoxy-manno-octulosonate cytidylyltransferase (CMP-KDO synthetase)